MTYRIVFHGGFCGVTTLHNTEESAEKHIKLLCEMTPRHSGWQIFHLGEEIKSSQKRERNV
jgi:hypothetical protein